MEHDQFFLERFLVAQDYRQGYERALGEIRAGRKRTHWIWYIFPQHVALEDSPMSELFGLRSAEEARAYLEHEVLRDRLLEICTALCGLDTDDPVSVLGMTDAFKLRACCTLFRCVAPEYEIFDRLLQKYCLNTPCGRTLELIGREAPSGDSSPEG